MTGGKGEAVLRLEGAGKELLELPSDDYYFFYNTGSERFTEAEQRGNDCIHLTH